MSWLYSIVVALLGAAAGLFGAGGVAMLCVQWYRISSREGQSGYFVVILGLLGGVAGLLVGLVGARIAAADGGGFFTQAGVGLGAVALLATIGLGLSRAFAHVPPKHRGREMELDLEVRLPESVASAEGSEASVTIASVSFRRRKQLRCTNGTIAIDKARREEGRLIVPASAPIFTSRAHRVLTFRIAGIDEAFSVSVAAFPAPSDAWSPWLPHPRVDGGPQVNTLTYRYRVRYASDA